MVLKKVFIIEILLKNAKKNCFVIPIVSGNNTTGDIFI